MKARVTDKPAKICNRMQSDSNIMFFGTTVYLPPEDSHRNAPCPCGSGKKYKRCCGKDKTPLSRKKIYITTAKIMLADGTPDPHNVVGIALCEDGRILATEKTNLDMVKHSMGIISEAFHSRYEIACHPFGYELEWIDTADVQTHEGYQKAMLKYQETMRGEG